MIKQHWNELKKKAVRVVESRIPFGERDANMYYYFLRHSETDWSVPVTIEVADILVNFWGTLVTGERLTFLTEENDYTDNFSGEQKEDLSNWCYNGVPK